MKLTFLNETKKANIGSALPPEYFDLSETHIFEWNLKGKYFDLRKLACVCVCV